jgi:hypothetical protein
MFNSSKEFFKFHTQRFSRLPVDIIILCRTIEQTAGAPRRSFTRDLRRRVPTHIRHDDNKPRQSTCDVLTDVWSSMYA